MPHLPEKPAPLKAGDEQISASQFNRGFQMVPRHVAGAGGTEVEYYGDRMMIRTPKSAPNLPDISAYIATLVVLEELNDCLKCAGFRTPVDGGGLWTFQEYDATLEATADFVCYVAKPYILQKSPWNGQTLNGTTYSAYTLPGERTATTGGDAVQELIHPAYFPGDIIKAVKGVTGLYDPDGVLIIWQDENEAARRWQGPFVVPDGSTSVFTNVDWTFINSTIEYDGDTVINNYGTVNYLAAAVVNITSNTWNYLTSIVNYTTTTLNFLVNSVINFTSITLNFAVGAVINIAGAAWNFTLDTIWTISATKTLTINGPGNLTINAPFTICGYQFWCHRTIAAFNANQNDLALGGAATVFCISATVPVNLTGVAPSDTKQLIALLNIGAEVITLTNEDAASAAANRFSLGGFLASLGLRLSEGEACILWHDITNNRWKVLAHGRGNVRGSGTEDLLAVWSEDDTITHLVIPDANYIVGANAAGDGNEYKEVTGAGTVAVTFPAPGSMVITGSAGGMTVGTSTITGGTDTRILFNNAGVLGEYVFDTDGTLAANSDTRVATQKAIKTYVDAIAAGIKWKHSVRAATTAAGTLASSFENGNTIDGVVLATNDRILIKNQAAGAENGIYLVNASGTPTRAVDADDAAELLSAAVFVREGTANADKGFICTNDSITLGTTALVFVEFTGSTSGALLIANNLSDLASAATARTNLGLVAIASTGSGADLTNDTVTLAKIANASASSRLLGSGASGSGADYAELSLGNGLAMSGTTLMSTGPTQWAVKTSDQNNIGTSYADVTGTELTVAANTTYAFEFHIILTADATTTGIDIACNGPASPTGIYYDQLRWISTTSAGLTSANAYNNDTASTGSNGTDGRVYIVRGILVNGANSGTLVARVKREAAGGAVGPNALAGSYGWLKQLG